MISVLFAVFFDNWFRTDRQEKRMVETKKLQK